MQCNNATTTRYDRGFVRESNVVPALLIYRLATDMLIQ
jgi:hypothetical protein